MDHPLPGVLPAEFAGMARLDDGVLDVGGLKLHLPVRHTGVAVYVRRYTDDLTIAEIAVDLHGALAEEALDAENAEAERYPLGPKEYWHSKMVGKSPYGPDQHLMTADDFEEFWAEGGPQ